MKGEEIRAGRRQSGLMKAELAQILRISRDSLSKMERELEPVPPDLQLKVEAEFERQRERVYFGTARNVINSLVSEGYPLAELASIAGVTRAEARRWQIDEGEPGPHVLLELLRLPPPPQPRPAGRKRGRGRGRAGR